MGDAAAAALLAAWLLLRLLLRWRCSAVIPCASPSLPPPAPLQQPCGRRALAQVPRCIHAVPLHPRYRLRARVGHAGLRRSALQALRLPPCPPLFVLYSLLTLATRRGPYFHALLLRLFTIVVQFKPATSTPRETDPAAHDRPALSSSRCVETRTAAVRPYSLLLLESACHQRLPCSTPAATVWRPTGTQRQCRGGVPQRAPKGAAAAKAEDGSLSRFAGRRARRRRWQKRQQRQTTVARLTRSARRRRRPLKRDGASETSAGLLQSLQGELRRLRALAATAAAPRRTRDQLRRRQRARRAAATSSGSSAAAAS